MAVAILKNNPLFGAFAAARDGQALVHPHLDYLQRNLVQLSHFLRQQKTTMTLTDQGSGAYLHEQDGAPTHFRLYGLDPTLTKPAIDQSWQIQLPLIKGSDLLQVKQVNHAVTGHALPVTMSAAGLWMQVAQQVESVIGSRQFAAFDARSIAFHTIPVGGYGVRVAPQPSDNPNY